MDIILLELLLAYSGDLAALLPYLNEFFDPETVASIITEDTHGL